MRHALVNDEFSAVAAARGDPSRLAVLGEPAAPESYAFVLRRGRMDLKRRIDAGLVELREAGVAAELRERFGLERDAAWPVGLR
jgi:ABC-type amino acid transport substrate-binding protein